jgi:hypothetical protein
MDDGATNTQSFAGTNRFALPIFIERFCIRISLGPPVNRHKEQSWYPAKAKGPHGLTRSSNSFSKNPSTMCELTLSVVVSIQPTARKAVCLSNGKKSNGFRSSIPDKATSSRTNVGDHESPRKNYDSNNRSTGDLCAALCSSTSIRVALCFGSK